MEGCIKIEVGSNTFNIDLNKITDMTVTSDTEMQNQYVSSTGGAIGGALLFGPLGAMVAGRAKKKQTKTTTYYFVITYTSNDEVKYISFYVGQSMLILNKFIKRFSENKVSSENIEIDL